MPQKPIMALSFSELYGLPDSSTALICSIALSLSMDNSIWTH